MRIIFTLVIAYCFGRVLPEDSNEEREDREALKKYYFVQPRPSSVFDLRERKTFQFVGNETGSNFYGQTRRRSRRHADHKKSHRRSHSHKFSGGRYHRGRNVSTYDTRDDHLRSSSKTARHRASRPHRKIKATADEKGESHAEEQGEESMDWDDWSDWTKCSVTCGNGRRVRWRHCSSEKCPIRGLKRAQMKACHLEDCPNKGLLSWLGIKS